MATPRTPGAPRPTPGGRSAPKTPPAKPAAKITGGALALTLILGLLAFGCGFGALTVQADLSQPFAAAGAPTQAFTVNQGDTFKTVTANLEQQKLIRSALVFQYYVKFKGLNPTVDPGTYQLTPSMRLNDILAVFAKGVSAPVATITLIPGTRLSEFADEIISGAKDQTGKPTTLPNFSKTDFNNIVINGAAFTGSNQFWWVQPWNLKGGAYAALEGYLWPDTYQIDPTWDATKIVRFLLEQTGLQLCPGPAGNVYAYMFDQTTCMAHQATITVPTDKSTVAVPGAGQTIGIFDALKSRNETLQQGLILASLAQREARSPANFFLVAGTYYDRWKHPQSEAVGTLGADPAYQYYLGSQPGATDVWPALQRLPSQTETNNPWNLYAVKGMPPSAISAVSQPAFWAGIFPPIVPYLYFYFGKDCQNHYFATFAQDNAEQNTVPVASATDCQK